MLREEIIRKFLEYENSHPVDDYICLDWNCWPLLRIVSSYQLNQENIKDPAGLQSGLAGHIRQKITGMPLLGPGLRNIYNRELARRMERELQNVLGNDSPRSDSPDTPGTDVVILMESERRVRLGDSLFDIYSDPVVKNLLNRGLACLVWEQGHEIWPRYSNSAWISKRLLIETAGIRNPVSKTPPSWYTEFSNWSKATFGYQLQWPVLRDVIYTVHARSMVFRTWLENCDARLLISVCWYNPVIMAATMAAKHLDITTVDLQHGIQDNGHFAYAGWNHVPSRAYELVPDYFWSWGSGEAKRLLSANPAFNAQSGTIVGGNLWYNLWRDDDALHADLPDNIFRGMPGKKTILVTLQHGPANFTDLLFEAIRECPNDWFWLIRFHPATPTPEAKHIRVMLNTLGADNFDYKVSSTTALYTLLGNSDVHITGHSTSALEALGFGVPTITVNENGAAAFKEYIDYGVIITARTSVTIKEAVKMAAGIPADKCRESVSRVFAVTSEVNQGINKLLHAANIPG